MTTGTTMTRPPAILLRWLLLLVWTTALGMAVDRSKFRTCQQTSFCRRHRDAHSQRLYRYRLDADSVHLHVPDTKTAPEPPVGGGGVWKSLQRKLIGEEKAAKLDPYVRGPPPTLTGILVNTADETSSGSPERLQWTVSALEDGLLRMRIHEVYGEASTAYEQARVTYDELVLVDGGVRAAEHARWIRPGDAEHDLLMRLAPENTSNYMALQYGDAEGVPGHVLLLQLEPFTVELYRETDLTQAILVLGAENMMHFEIRRFQDASKDKQPPPKETTKAEDEQGDKPDDPDKEIVGYWEDGLAIYADGTREERKETSDHRQLTEAELDREGLWEESFSSHTDSKPKGPMSVGLDIAFPKSKHLYGIPEHASSAVLQTTIGEGAHYKDPYRLYNLDVFEYELDETMALYGSIPLIVSQSLSTGTTGIFWFNPTETFIDVMQSAESSTTHWMSESGIIDVFLIPGPDPPSFYRQYARLTGTQALPPMFSLGYHQCRWNYKDEKDVYQVHTKFEELDYPYDVLWLDIEHTDGKRYFTWDANLFPHPAEMQQNLASQGRRMVTIIDPHIFRDSGYYVHKEATSKGYYIKKADGKTDFDGWCWPGSSSYLDFTSEKVRDWWAEQFQYSRYKGSTPTLFTWNDMNEPSVFNGPEVSMQKDLKNLNGEEHREWHNLYGMLFHQATALGQIRRNEGEDVRPFVLSRAFFAGTQRIGAIWTGDNAAEWGHLEMAAPMLLSLNSAALSFVGADVGGFFGNPSAELFTRWMQAGAYQPFFRGHAHHDSARREPWMFDDDTLHRLRRAAMARYALLPFWYTVFAQAETTGMPVMRMMWMQYPKTAEFFGVDDQYLVGSDLLVKPITASEATETTLLFPTDDSWYDVETMQVVSTASGQNGVNSVTVPAPIDKIPVYQRGGSIIPRKLRLRRSAMLMKTDPYTLYIALDSASRATGELHMDDEETFGYQKHEEYTKATFTADFASTVATITNEVMVGKGWADQVENLYEDRLIERIVVVGVSAAPASIKVNGKNLTFTYSDSMLVIRKPELPALAEWALEIAKA